MKNYALLLTVTVLLVACGDKEYTIDELYNDKTLREKIIEECKNNPRSKDSTNCRNAVAAHKRHFSGSGGNVQQW